MEITYETYRKLTEENPKNGISLDMKPIRYSVNVKDNENNLYYFKSDGIEVKAKDLIYVSMRSKRSRNRYSYLKHNDKEKLIMRSMLTLYAENGAAKEHFEADKKRIRNVIDVVTQCPVSFVLSDEGGLMRNTITVNQSD